MVAGSPALAQGGDTGNVTFHKDVEPILQRSCQSCHRQGAMAPMSLLSYEEVRPWARSIKRYVETREMPPWYVDRRIGIQDFKDTFTRSRRLRQRTRPPLAAKRQLISDRIELARALGGEWTDCVMKKCSTNK